MGVKQSREEEPGEEEEVDLSERPLFTLRGRKSSAPSCCVQGLWCSFDEKGQKGSKAGQKG